MLLCVLESVVHFVFYNVLSIMDPVMAMAIASRKAAVQLRTANPFTRLLVNFIMNADTMIRTTKVNRNKVSTFNGKRIRKPMVALSIPMSRQTQMAVP